MLPLAILALFLGVFLLVAAILSPVFRSKRKERVATIDQYGLGSLRPTPRKQASPSALSEQLIQMGDRVMEGRESTTKTMRLLDRADLPWRAGEWFVLRILAVIVGRRRGPPPARGTVVDPRPRRGSRRRPRCCRP